MTSALTTTISIASGSGEQGARRSCGHDLAPRSPAPSRATITAARASGLENTSAAPARARQYRQPAPARAACSGVRAAAVAHAPPRTGSGRRPRPWMASAKWSRRRAGVIAPAAAATRRGVGAGDQPDGRRRRCHGSRRPVRRRRRERPRDRGRRVEQLQRLSSGRRTAHRRRCGQDHGRRSPRRRSRAPGPRFRPPLRASRSPSPCRAAGWPPGHPPPSGPRRRACRRCSRPVRTRSRSDTACRPMPCTNGSGNEPTTRGHRIGHPPVVQVPPDPIAAMNRVPLRPARPRSR